MQVLSNKCYICDLSAMDDGNLELELGLVKLGEDNSADEQPTFLVLQVLGEKKPLIGTWRSFSTKNGKLQKGQSYPRFKADCVCRATDFGLQLFLQSIKQSAKRATPFYGCTCWIQFCAILMKPRFCIYFLFVTWYMELYSCFFSSEFQFLSPTRVLTLDCFQVCVFCFFSYLCQFLSLSNNQTAIFFSLCS